MSTHFRIAPIPCFVPTPFKGFRGRGRVNSCRREKPLNVLKMCTPAIPKCSSTADSMDYRKWQCMCHCGACCKLGDFDKDVLQDLLKSEADVVEYLNMVGTNGWCKWYDLESRKCTQYEERPRFCRATPEVFSDLYNVKESQFDQFAISCCEYHISNVYGEESIESFKYDDFIAEINEEL